MSSGRMAMAQSLCRCRWYGAGGVQGHVLCAPGQGAFHITALQAADPAPGPAAGTAPEDPVLGHGKWLDLEGSPHLEDLFPGIGVDRFFRFQALIGRAAAAGIARILVGFGVWGRLLLVAGPVLLIRLFLLLALFLGGFLVMGVVMLVVLLFVWGWGRSRFTLPVAESERRHPGDVLILHLKPFREGGQGPGRLFDDQIGPVPCYPGLGA